jgi:hypothetical protein
MVLDGLRRGDAITASARAFLEAGYRGRNLRVLFEDAPAGFRLLRRDAARRDAPAGQGVRVMAAPARRSRGQN